MRRIAIVGAGGQLGITLRSHSAFAADTLVPLDRRAIDITDPDSVANALNAVQPHFVINAAAYNFVDRAESEPEVAYAVNALGPRNLAIWCDSNAATLLHVSTDYVFGGESTVDAEPQSPRRVSDLPRPLSAYGVSKLAGEHFARAHCQRHFVVRTCGLYGRTSGSKGNFVETMLRLGRERPELRVVADQVCTPTSTADLADAIVLMIASEQYGLYHVTIAGQTTWHEFACEIFRQSGQNVAVKAITTAEYGAAAQRPSYSVLDCSKLARVLGRSMPAWQDALTRYLAIRGDGA